MTNVLMIAPEPFREPRGTPISIYQRLRALASLGHTVDLVTYPVGDDVSIQGVRIHRIPRLPFVKQVKIGPSWAKLVLDVLLFCKAAAMLVRTRYDVIHSHEEAAYFSIILAATFRTRHVYDMHSSLPRQLTNFGLGRLYPVVKLFDLLERWAVGTCDAVITIGADLEDHVRAMKPAARLVRIENLPVQSGVCADERSVAELRQRLGLNGRIPIVYTGTFEPYQGIGLLLDSAAIVKRHHPEVIFVLVGGKPQQVEHWRDEVRRNQLEDCVILVGTVPLEDMPAYMELAEILVSPRTGGISVPLKIYTYLLSGKPVVATNLSTHTMILNDEIALLAAPDKEAFAEGVVTLIRNPELRRQVGFKARQFAEEKYNPADYLAKLDTVYRSLQIPPRVQEQPTPCAKG